MDYKEKYEQGLDCLEEILSSGQEKIKMTLLKERLLPFFPELKESEDERIRKALVRVLNENVGNGIEKYGAKLEEALAWLEEQKSVGEIVERCKNSWYNEGKIAGMAEGLTDDEKYQQGWHDALEKQGEKKPTDKVEPKFKVGDWVVDNHGEVNQISSATDDGYGFCLYDGTYVSGCWKDYYHLWTIQDAKDGDVLVDVYGTIGIFQKNDDFDWSSYCSLGSNGGFRCFAIEHELDRSHPATKEQRDLLFQKIKEAGYQWDAEKKELKKIHVIDEGKAEMDYCFTKMMNGEKVSSTWSDQDEENLQHCCGAIGAADYYTYDDKQEMEEWLKSLKERLS